MDYFRKADMVKQKYYVNDDQKIHCTTIYTLSGLERHPMAPFAKVMNINGTKLSIANRKGHALEKVET